jgi:ABC-type branched-subunit amino acid transport system permease subunit
MPRGGILSLPAESVIPTLQRIMSENPALLLTGGPGEALVTRGDGIFLGSVLAAAVVAAACGYLVGLPSLRLKGDYLAIVTLGFGEIVRVVLQATGPQARPTVGAASELAGDTSSMGVAARMLTNVPLGGAQGFNFIPTYASLFWIYLFVTVSLIAMYRIKASSSGRAFLSIREDEIAAQAMGVHVSRAKVRAFVLAAGFAGIAGALASHQSFSITPADFGFQRSFEILIMVVLGGLGSISGAALAAVVLTLLPEALRDPSVFVDAWPAVVGVSVAMAVAGGVLWRVARQQDRVRHLPYGLLGGAGALLVLLGVFTLADWQEWNLGKYRLIFYALALILMLMLRPQGLLGVSEVWERGLWRHAFGRRRGGAKAGAP